MIKRFRPTGTYPQPDSELTEAVEEMAKSLPPAFFVDHSAIENLIEEYKNARRRNNDRAPTIMNDIFDHLYGVYVYLNVNPADLDRFLINRGYKDIKVDPAIDLCHILAEYYLGGRSKKAIKYAAALCQAALQHIKVGSLAGRLGNGEPKGMTTMPTRLQRTSIKAMAEEFADRQKKLRKPRSGGQ